MGKGPKGGAYEREYGDQVNPGNQGNGGGLQSGDGA